MEVVASHRQKKAGNMTKKMANLSVKVGLRKKTTEADGTEEEERVKVLTEHHLKYQTRQRTREPYALTDPNLENHNWFEIIRIVPRQSHQDNNSIIQYITSNNVDEMKKATKHARKLRAALSKLSVKRKKKDANNGRDAKQQEPVKPIEAFIDDHLAVVRYRAIEHSPDVVESHTQKLLANLTGMPENILTKIVSNLDDFDIACLAATCHRFRGATIFLRPGALDIPVRINLPPLPPTAALTTLVLRLGSKDRFMPMDELFGLPGTISRVPAAYETWFKMNEAKNPDQHTVSKWEEIVWTPVVGSIAEARDLVTRVTRRSDTQRPELMGGFRIWSKTHYVSQFRTPEEVNKSVLGDAPVCRLFNARKSIFD